MEQALKLRYALMPYLYSLAGAVTHRSYTLFRALAFDFRNDERVHGIGDQFMFGPAFMVAPVTEAMYYGPRSQALHDTHKGRGVYLPAGGWYNFRTGEWLEGGRTIDAAADLQTLPLFVRAGSIVPMGPDVQHADEQAGGDLTLRIYPGRDAEFDLYEDEGDSYRYEQGQYTFIPLHWDEASGKLTIGERTGSYRGMAAARAFTVEIAGKPQTTRTVNYDGQPLTVSIER